MFVDRIPSAIFLRRRHDVFFCLSINLLKEKEEKNEKKKFTQSHWWDNGRLHVVNGRTREDI